MDGWMDGLEPLQTTEPAGESLGLRTAPKTMSHADPRAAGLGEGVRVVQIQF
jgi:hypothetical protein